MERDVEAFLKLKTLSLRAEWAEVPLLREIADELLRVTRGRITDELLYRAGYGLQIESFDEIRENKEWLFDQGERVASTDAVVVRSTRTHRAPAWRRPTLRLRPFGGSSSSHGSVP